VRDTAAYPSPVRAVGELHSLNESIETDGTAVFMTHFRKIGEPDPVTNTVTVGAGLRMIDLTERAEKARQQLPSCGIGNATAGSVACCGTRTPRSAHRSRQISSTAVAFGCDADGRAVR